MPLIELVDETFVAASPDLVAGVVHDQGRWAEWWPDLELTPFMDRGQLGIRWSASSISRTGSLEIWLEPVRDGVIVHHYQRLDPSEGTSRPGRRAVTQERDRRARAWKARAFALKDSLEGARRPGAAGSSTHPHGSRNDAQMPTKGG